MNITSPVFPIDTTAYVREAMAMMFHDYRLMIISMTLAVGIALLIASSCAKREPLTPTQFVKLFWVELCSIGAICIYGIYTVFHMANEINMM